MSHTLRPRSGGAYVLRAGALLIAGVLAAVALTACTEDEQGAPAAAGQPSTASQPSTPPASTGPATAVPRDLEPDPKAIATGTMLFGVTGAPLEATADAPFVEENAAFLDHPLQLDVELPELTLQQVDLGDVLKVPFTARFETPSQPGSTILELYVLVDDRLVGTARYPSTRYLEEVAVWPVPVQPGDTVGVQSAVYIASILWECDEPIRAHDVEIIAVLWNDSGGQHGKGPWDGGPANGLWSTYESIRGGAATAAGGVSRLNFKEESRPFIVGMPFFADEAATDDGALVAHAGDFRHEVDVWEAYWDYPVEPTELALFPSDVAHLTLHGFAPAGLWVGGPTSTDLLPPLRADAGVVVGTIAHGGPEHLTVESYDTLWWVSALGENTLFPDEPDFAAEFLFDWMADEVEIGGERLCNDEFNVGDVSPPPTGTPFIPDLTATPTPTPTEPPTIATPTPTPTEPAETATPTPTPTEAAPTTTVQQVEVFVLSDLAGHAEFIGAMPGQLTVTVTGSTISVSGGGAFVPVSGNLAGDGTFVATGTGTVAGFTGIAVSFTGNLTDGRITGEYTMGGNGGLPTGTPITYQVQ